MVGKPCVLQSVQDPFLTGWCTHVNGHRTNMLDWLAETSDVVAAVAALRFDADGAVG